MSKLKPWTYGPFELILHAEQHRRDGGDFDRRIAHIGFDNSIEVSITTYLSLHPVQREGREYRKEDVANWLKNYHTKLDFLEGELTSRGVTPLVTTDEIIWYHSIRNNQYHGGFPGIPEERHLLGIRKAALWVFSVLFDVQNVEEVLENHIAEILPRLEEKPEREEKVDRFLDETFGLIELAGQYYPASELLFAVDPIAYRATGEDMKSGEDEEVSEELEGKE